jgi:TonB family protein
MPTSPLALPRAGGRIVAVFCLSFGLAFFSAAMTHAQSLLFASYDDTLYPVRAVRGLTPEVKIAGKLKPVVSGQYLFKKVPAFSDGSIQVDQFSVTSRYLTDGVNDMNRDLVIRGYLTSTRTLTNCFLALELNENGRSGSGIAMVELPTLEAGKRRDFNVRLPLERVLEEGHYHIHIFSSAGEHAWWRADRGFSRAETAKSDSSLLEHTPSRSPEPIITVSPAYPEKLKREQTAGKASVRCHISAEGEVLDATVNEATRPEFGEAAIAAVKKWFFIPAIKNHQYADVTVTIPFNFAPPSPAAITDTKR